MTRLFILLFSLFALSACFVKEKSEEKNNADPKPTGQPGEVMLGDKARRIDEHLSKLVNENNFSGGLFISRNDTLIFCKGYGLANRASNIAFTPKTPACIGSITKNFTATGILALCKQGKLSLTDKLSVFFPDVPNDKKDITLHQLLTHSSGFHEFLQNDGGDFEKIETEDFLKRAFGEPLAFKPGTKAVYTNVGMSIAAIIIEKISGKDYEDFLKDNFFSKYNMPTLAYYDDGYDSTKLAAGYNGKNYWGTLPQRYKMVGGGPYWNLKGNGGLYASLEDMYNWSKMFHNPSALPDSLVEKMFTPHMEEDGTGGLFWFGYGCNITKSKRGTKIIDNGGSNGIYHARLVRLPEEGLVFYMVTNNNAMNTNKVLPQITQLYFEGHVSENAQANLNQFEFKGSEFIYKTMLEKGPDYFTKNIFKELKENGFPLSDDMIFLEAGQRLIADKKIDEAFALYKIYTANFPDIIVAWNDLGEVYLLKGNKPEAKKCFEQALKLKPDNERAKRMLKQL